MLYRWLLPKEKGRHQIRQKSLLIPVAHREPKSGSLKRGHIFITQVRRSEGGEAGEGYAIEMPEDKDIKEIPADSSNSGNCSNNATATKRVDDTSLPYIPGKIPEAHPRHRHPGSLGGTVVKEGDGMTENRNGAGCGTWNGLFEELLSSIRTLINKQEEVEAQNNLVAEWRLVAQVVDRILFWCFFSFTFCSSALILVVLPIYKRSYGSPLVNDTDVMGS